MANISTFKQLSEFIQTQHYNGHASPDAEITQPHIAQRIAVKLAKMAKISAFENSNQGETTYASDQFITPFYNLALLTNSATGEKYCVLPATPVGLPKGTEFTQVSFTGAPNVHVIPMSQKDDFVESILPPLPSKIVLYKIENGNIVFRSLPAIINSPVNVKMIGAISGATLMSSVLNCPKDFEDRIVTEILQELAQEYGVPPNKIQSNSAA
jgi:hypothetical protein